MPWVIDRGFHSSVLNRTERKAVRVANAPFRGTMFARVRGSLADSERVSVESVLGEKTTSFAYPFASTNAWIRGQPESGTVMTAIIGGDTNDIQPVGYYDPQKSTAAERYANAHANLRQQPSAPVPTQVQPYRILNPGELDIGSSFAQTFFGYGDVAQARGGTTHFSQQSTEARLETPLLRVEGPAHFTGYTLRDEIRFGVVRRAVPGASNPTLPSFIKGSGVNTRNPTAPLFAKEYSVLLDWFGTPGKLLDHRQGIVTEDNGTPARSAQTGRPLRGRFRWHTATGFTEAEVDESGSFFLRTATEATDGGAVAIPTGPLLLNIGRSLTVQTTEDTRFSATGRYSLDATAGFRLATPAQGEVNASGGLSLRSLGQILLDTPIGQGIALGAGLRYPVLVANPTYIATLQAYLSSELSLSGLLAAYGAAAAAAFGALGPLTMLIDPTGTVNGLCLAAAGAAGAMATGATATNAALAAHTPTLTSMPAGFISGKTSSE